MSQLRLGGAAEESTPSASPICAGPIAATNVSSTASNAFYRSVLASAVSLPYDFAHCSDVVSPFLFDRWSSLQEAEARLFLFHVVERPHDQESHPAQAAVGDIVSRAVALGLPVPRVTPDHDGGYEIEFRQKDVFADLDVFSDGEIVASTGGRGRQARARRVERYELAEVLTLFRSHLR